MIPLVGFAVKFVANWDSERLYSEATRLVRRAEEEEVTKLDLDLSRCSTSLHHFAFISISLVKAARMTTTTTTTTPPLFTPFSPKRRNTPTSS
jgi:hypothetical protein